MNAEQKSKRTLWVWSAGCLWFLSLALLLEYSLTSFAEYEPQAGVLAGAIFLGLLLAGLITIFVRTSRTHPLYTVNGEHDEP